MSKLNLSEAAAKILQEDAASNFEASRTKSGAEPFGVGNPKAVKKATAPQTGEVDIGDSPTKTKDSNPVGTKGMGAKATLPTGPGVAGEPMHKLPSQPQQTMGRSDLTNAGEESPESSDEQRRDRVKSKTGKDTIPANKGAQKPFVPESSGDDEEWEPEDEEQEWEDEEELEEASMEEVQSDLKKLDDKSFAKKYGMSKEKVAAKLKQMQTEEATVEEVMEDLESLSEEDFAEKYGLSKEDASNHLKEMEEESCKMQEKEEAKKARKEKMKEDVDAMLSGENLSEDFKEKAAMIFEAAVESRVEEIALELEEQFVKEFEESLELVKEDFAEKLDSYLDYVVENWMQENELAIEKGLRSEIVEDFIGALRNVFVEHYIDIPEEKVDIVEELAEKVESLEEQVNEQILKNIELKKSLSEQKKVEIIHSVCEGLTMSQVEKIKSLAKNVEFVSEEEFEEKLETIKESYFPSGIISASSDSLNEALEIDEDDTTEVVDPLIKAYANKISKNIKF